MWTSLIDLLKLYMIAKDLKIFVKLLDRSYLLGTSRRQVDYEKILKNSKNFIYCFGLTWKSFSSDRYSDILVTKLNDPVFKIRMLLLDPDSEVARIRKRSKIYSDRGRDFQDELIHGLKFWKNIHKRISNLQNFTNIKDRFDVRLYSDLPPASLLFVDDVLYLGFYTQISTGGSSPYLLVKRRKGVASSLYDVMLNHFNIIWEDGNSIIY